MLEAVDVRSGYGTFEVLHDVSLDVGANEIVALLGHNGAGKTTLLRAMYGALPRWTGDVRFGGQALPADSRQAAAVGIRYVPQEANVFPNLSVNDNLRLGAYSEALSAERMAERRQRVFDLFPGLRERQRIAARNLSGGQRQMLAIGMALMTAPRLLLLDEPSAGLAPVLVQRVFDTILDMRERLGLAVLLVEQNVNEALRVASRVYVMQEGRLVFSGSSAQREEAIRHLWGLTASAPR